MSHVPHELREPWTEFLGKVESRLRRGAEEYGGTSLRASPPALVSEVEEELLDVVGWSFMLWLRVRAMAKNLKRGEASYASDEETS